MSIQKMKNKNKNPASDKSLFFSFIFFPFRGSPLAWLKEMIKEKIKSGWKGFQGHLYYISESTMIYPEAILECEDLDSVLAPIFDLETEVSRMFPGLFQP